MPISDHYRPHPVYPDLGAGFFDAVAPANFPSHIVRYRNQRWAKRVGLAELETEEWQNHFGAFKPLPDNIDPPLAMRYHGHQFRHYNPDIGDGRGFLYAQLKDKQDGRLLDLATKGSGQTPYSRTADGRLTLKGGVREVLVTALLEALGVYTSKSFSLIETGEQLQRHDEPSPTRSAVLVRLSHSHIRFGTFQRQAFEQNKDRLWQLVNYAIEHYFPHLKGPDGEQKVEAFLLEVSNRSAVLVASWLAAGFVHGVLNTDNMNITGESFDYGPYRMLPIHDARFVAAYFDDNGIYSYGQQPTAVFWNLQQLAGALSELCDKERLIAVLETFPDRYRTALKDQTLFRLGLQQDDEASDFQFVGEIYAFMNASQIGFERFFFDWYGGKYNRANLSPHAELYTNNRFALLKDKISTHSSLPSINPHAPYFTHGRPCTLLIDEIEDIWDHIAKDDDWTAFERKLNDIEIMRKALAAPEYQT